MRSLLVLFCLFSFSAFAQEQATFYFDSGKYTMQKAELDKLNQWMLDNKDCKVIGVYGFCDDEGSVVLNDTLAKRRVEFVFNKIKGRIMFREDFKTRAFGELHTMSKVKAENRKITLYYIHPKDFAKEDEIIGVKKPAEEAKPSEEVLADATPEPVIEYPKQLEMENPDGTVKIVDLDTVFMKKLYHAKTGEKYVLENINFYVDTYAVMPTSMPKMQELLFVMQSNPELVIQLQGHICCVGRDVRNLSTQRARAIYKFLEYNKIDKSRMSYIGLGVSQPIYKIPETSLAQQEANRRVEVLIIKNKNR